MQPDNTELLKRLLAERILVLDGGMGTMLQNYRLTEADYRSQRFVDHSHDLRGNHDLLVLTQPDIVREVHAMYLEAGADLISSNTFNSTAASQYDYRLEHLVSELNFNAARLAREVADQYTEAQPDKPRFVAGVLGPTSKTASISPDVNDPAFRNVSFDELKNGYREALAGLLDGGADLILIETVFDTLNAKAAIFACEEEFEARGQRLPLS